MKEIILKTIEDIKEKIFKDIDIYDKDGNIIASTSKRPSYMTILLKQDYYIDEKKNKTVMRFEVKNEIFFCVINGVSEEDRKFIYLICELLKNSVLNSSALNLTREDYFKMLISSQLGDYDAAKFLSKYKLNDKKCYTLVLNVENNKTAEVLNLLTQYSNNTLDCFFATDNSKIVYIKINKSEKDEDFRSPADFADFLLISLQEELNCKVKIGIGNVVNSAMYLYNSYEHASLAVKLSKVFNVKGNIFSYTQFLLVKIFNEIPKIKLEEYLEQLMPRNLRSIFNNAELVSTAEEFLENSLNISETSRKLFMHRNTLIYRLDKLESETGLNIKKFSDAINFRIITILIKLIENV